VADPRVAGRAIVSAVAAPTLRARREIRDLAVYYPNELEKFKAVLAAMQSHAVEAETAWYANANDHAGRCGTHAPQFEVHKTLNFIRGIGGTCLRRK